MALFYFGSPLALMLGGPISGLLLEQNGWLGFQGWQWMFLVEGALASVVGICAYFCLTDGPRQARWMPPEEQTALSEAIAAEEDWKRLHGASTLRDLLRDRRMLQFIAIYFLIQVTGYGVAFYLPTQVSKLLGTQIGLRVGIISAIPWACAIVATCFWPGWAAATGWRRTFACVSLLLAVGGLCVSAHLPPGPSDRRLMRCNGGDHHGATHLLVLSDRLPGRDRRAAGGLAAINALGNVGGFAAPPLKTFFEQKFDTSAAGLYFLAASGLGAIALVLTLPSSPAAGTTAFSHRPQVRGLTVARRSVNL